MRNIYALGKRFISIIKQEGVSAALKAVYSFLADKYSRFKYSLLVRYYNTFHHGLALRKIQGNKMYLSVNDLGLSRDLLLHGIREPLQTNLVKQLIKPGMTVADIGANLGYYVLIEASIVGESGKIYAIEPVPSNYEILKKNVYKNNYQSIVETHLCAIGDTCEVSKMAMTTSSNFSTMFLNEEEMSDWMKKQLKVSTEKILEVETLTLDKFLVGKRPIDFVRMDVEGYEGKIIKGMSNTAKNSRNRLQMFIEIHPGVFENSKATLAELIQDLTDMGLRVKFIVNTEGTELLEFSEDNLLETLCAEWAPAIFLDSV